jgi:copper chaperone CopZ
MKTLTLALLLSLPLAASAALQPDAARAEAPALRSVTLEITGMVTKNCPVLVKQAVSRIEGVVAVEASLETKTAQVRFDPSKTSPEQIRRVIKDRVGFDAKVR